MFDSEIQVNWGTYPVILIGHDMMDVGENLSWWRSWFKDLILGWVINQVRFDCDFYEGRCNAFI